MRENGFTNVKVTITNPITAKESVLNFQLTQAPFKTLTSSEPHTKSTKPYKR